MKIGIIGGAGLVGSTTAFCLGMQGLADEIVLIDVNKKMLLAHAWDMEQAVNDTSRTQITYGSWDALKDCDMVLHCASVNESDTASRDECLALNYKILQQAAENITGYCPDAVVVMASNPVDVLNYGIFRLIGGNRRKFVGFSRNDTLRLKWAIAKKEGVYYDEVEALSVGEHGFMTVPLYSGVKIRGVQKNYNEEEQKKLNETIIHFFTRYQELKSGRSSGWTSGVSLAEICRRILSDDAKPVPCSVVLDGEYGLSGLSLSVPVRLGSGGVREILTAQMNAREHEKFIAAAGKIKKQIADLDI